MGGAPGALFLLLLKESGCVACYSAGNRRLPAFLSDDDYRAYIDLMSEWCGRRGSGDTRPPQAGPLGSERFVERLTTFKHHPVWRDAAAVTYGRSPTDPIIRRRESGTREFLTI
jgi:hypothetical protein